MKIGSVIASLNLEGFFNHIIDSPINEMKGHYELHAKLENGELLYELPQFLEIVDLTDFDLVSPDVFK